MPDRTPFTRHRRTRQLDAYWDSVVEGGHDLPIVPVNVDRVDALLVRRMQSLASSPAPDPEFAARLEQTLMNAYSPTASSPLSDIVPGTPPRRHDRQSGLTGTRDAAPVSRRRRATAPPPRTAGPLRPAFQIALVILLVLASIGGTWWTINRQDEPQRLVAPEVATPSADASPEVTMYRGNPAHTGEMPGPGLDGLPVELWRAQAGNSIHSAPAIVDGVLYIGAGDSGVRAFDVRTGELRWEFASDAPTIASPAVVEGKLYIGSEDDTLYALDATNGTELWSLPNIRTSTHVVVSDGRLYTGTNDNAIVALDPATGEELWRVPLPARANRAPAVADGIVYVGSGDGMVHALSASTGETIWTFQTEGGGLLSAGAISNGTAIWGTFEGPTNYVYAFDAATGDLRWRFESANNPGFLAVAANGETVFAPSVDTHVYALDIATGEQVWAFETDGMVNASPALVGDTLYVAGNDGFLYAVNASTGMGSWRFAIDGSVDYGPVVIGGVAYLGTGTGSLYAIGGSNQFPGVSSSTPASTPGASAIASPVITAPASPVASDGIATLAWESPDDVFSMGQPNNVTIARDGTIWVAHSGQSTFEIFAPDGTHLETWGVPGVKDGEFNFMKANGDAFGAVAFAPDGTFYVADTGNRRIQHFSADRAFLNAWGVFGGEDGQFISPIDIAVDSEGNVFVDDDNRDDIQKFAPDGTWLMTFGGTGSEPGQLDAQGFLTISADDTIWVADPEHQRIQQWDNDGTFLQAIDTSELIGAPLDIAFDSEGRLYITDVGNAQVVILSPDGSTVLGAWGVAGDGLDQFILPNSVRIDPDGNVYVLDLLRATLMKFTLEVSRLAEPGATPGATPVP